MIIKSFLKYHAPLKTAKEKKLLKNEHLITPILNAIRKKITTEEKTPNLYGNETWESTVVVLKPIELYRFIVKYKDKDIEQLYAAITEQTIVSSVEI